MSDRPASEWVAEFVKRTLQIGGVIMWALLIGGVVWVMTRPPIVDPVTGL